MKEQVSLNKKRDGMCPSDWSGTVCCPVWVHQDVSDAIHQGKLVVGAGETLGVLRKDGTAHLGCPS